MAKGDYDPIELRSMARQAIEPAGGYRTQDEQQRGASQLAIGFTKAENALRVASQLSAADLQFCVAFGLDPFAYLAAKLGSADKIAAERQDRIEREDFRERERRQREAWGEGQPAVSDPFMNRLQELARG